MVEPKQTRERTIDRMIEGIRKKMRGHVPDAKLLRLSCELRRQEQARDRMVPGLALGMPLTVPTDSAIDQVQS